MGIMVQKNGNIEIWTRLISPLSKDSKYSYSIVVFNRNTLGSVTNVSIKLDSIGLNSPNCYSIYNVFDSEHITKYCPQDTLKIQVNPSRPSMVVVKVLN
ncbi:alpha-galactosidase [Trichonephila inaurata madagascariensis]|uniref:Alpha-galactosidase n=1 Tax=Trichonephila inaurata madagascariensis TaxID=2747483 RepID=A0A8X7BVJ4_9ARAC|nr:alpha-galactosidase [Trichonephila inaurata madagascariensis]